MITFSLFKLSLIFTFKAVNFLRASSISFESVINIKSDDDELGPFGDPATELVRDKELDVTYEEAVKLLHNLLKLTNFESISFSNCLACFLSAIRTKNE